MALRPIISIDVRDEAFNRFRDNFKAYEEALKSTPGEWEKVDKSVDSTRKSFQALVAASVARQRHAKSMAEVEEEASRHIERQERSWRDMARSTASVAGNILGATRSLLRWASLTGVFTGLLGVGGLFGIERLAASAGGLRRSSLGLGVTPGQQQAFGINYGRVVNAEGVLGGVSAALVDPNQRVGLYNAGLRENEIQGRNAAQVSVSLIDHLKALADQTDKSMLGAVHGGRRLGQFITLEDFQRLKNTPASELAEYRKNFGQDVGTLDLSPVQQRAWQNLQVQLERAGRQIETTFIKGLSPLAGPLEGLSRAFQETVTAVLSAPEMKTWITDLGEGIKWLGSEIRTKEFQDSVTGFVRDIGRLASSISRWVHWLGADKEPIDPKKYHEPGEPTEPGDQDVDKNVKGFLDWLRKHMPESGAPVYSPTGFTPGQGSLPFQALVHQAAWRPGSPTGFTPQPGGGGLSGNAAEVKDYFLSHGWGAAATAGLLANIQAESEFDPHRVNQVGGDAGLMQWRGPRARQFEKFFGHKVQEGTLQEQLWFAQWELTQGPERGHGDVLRQMGDPGAAGAYVATDIERPDPARIAIIAAQRAATAVRIYIQNLAGGSVAVSAAQLHGASL